MAKVNPIQVQKFLKGLNYPADRDQIVAHARDQGADKNAQDALERLPKQKYETPADVSHELGKIE